jgi:hypothetical protein
LETVLLGVGNVVLFEPIDLGRRGKNKRQDGSQSARRARSQLSIDFPFCVHE